MTELAQRIRAGLAAIAEPERAPAMQAYMKSTMPYFGVSSVPRRKLCRELFAGLEWLSREAWKAEVLAIWRGAEFREERYCATDLCALRSARAFHTIEALPMYEEMIVSGAWWDHIDEIAGHRLIAILRNQPEAMKRAMLGWARDDNMWKRRSAILCQLDAKGDTDPDFLYACIAPSLGSQEFFLRKAIGWALRQYARTDPGEVARYVKAHEAQLSPLSRREALKHIHPA